MTELDIGVFRDRRARVAAALQEAGGGIAVLPTAPERTRNADSEHPYRHDSHFFHLTGFVEPGAWLVLEASGHSVLFCRPRDPATEVWDGHRLGPQAAPEVLGVDAAHDIGALDEVLPPLLARHGAVWFPFADSHEAGARVRGWLDRLRAPGRNGTRAPDTQRDLLPVLDELRLHKDAHELALMRRAGAISAAAHVRAMRFCAQRLAAAPAGGLHEYEIEAELLHEFRRQGASGPAYTPIVAAAANACVLHYVAGAQALWQGEAARTRLQPGDLCLIDAGCEYGSYAADITRTFPASGRFSAPQRALYDVVLAAQAAAIDVTRPGVRKIDSHWAAVRVLAQGLLDLGLLDASRDGSVDDIIEKAAYRRFYMHGTGHWLGLDVHDAGDYLSRGEPAIEQPDGLGGRVLRAPSRRLAPGMVVTVEPGLYVRPADDVPEAFWNLGIRIEDDVIVTPDGPEVFTRGVPVAPDDIEAIMKT